MQKQADVSSSPVYTLPTVTTWRFQGERTSADQAYCARFNVSVAPEPLALAGSVWAYILPA